MTTIEHDPNEKPAQPKRTRWWMIAAAVAALAIGGTGLAMATDTVTAGSAAQFVTKAGFGGGFGGYRFERILEEIDATDEQTDKLWGIAGETFTSAWPMAREFRSAREDLQDLLTASTIDPAAIEKLRSERVAAIDELSRLVTAAVIEAAEVLTPEQRAELAGILEERRSHRRW